MKTVCCVMLVNGREAMVRRAIRSFKSQTYEAKRLIVLDAADNGAQHVTWGQRDDGAAIVLHSAPRLGLRSDLTIGRLRNVVNLGVERVRGEIIIHWDSDDWSHPNRIAEQVALLEASGKEAVGYRDMLFWRTVPDEVRARYAEVRERFPSEGSLPEHLQLRQDEAWLYTNRVPTYCLGTSLCYWREVWQRNPFADTSAGEDTLWLHNVKSLGQSSIPDDIARAISSEYEGRPRMIASIHGANTYAKIEPRAEEWKRVPEWDQHCRGVMAP